MIMIQKEKITSEKLNELFASVFSMEETKDISTQELGFFLFSGLFLLGSE